MKLPWYSFWDLLILWSKFLSLIHILSRLSWLGYLFLVVKKLLLLGDGVLGDTEGGRDIEKENDGGAVEGEKGRIWTLKEQAMSQQGHLQHTSAHACGGHACYLCVLCLCALCTYAWTHLPLPTNLCSVKGRYRLVYFNLIHACAACTCTCVLMYPNL